MRKLLKPGLVRGGVRAFGVLFPENASAIKRLAVRGANPVSLLTLWCDFVPLFERANEDNEMAQGGTLQNYNNELVGCIEEVRASAHRRAHSARVRASALVRRCPCSRVPFRTAHDALSACLLFAAASGEA